jgi:putative transposase
MPWKETGPMEQRRLFIQECLENGGPAVRICAAFGISRKTGYKWWNRFCSEGLSGLADRSRAPKRIPHKTAKSIEQKLLGARKLHASWGPRKLIADVARKHPYIRWPAASTVGDILKRHGLVPPRTLHTRTPPYTDPFGEVNAPNDVWCIDFKGYFRTQDRKRCTPLTVMDSRTRYLLCCAGLRRTTHTTVRAHLEQTFHLYGLPRAIRTDNGPPFASRGPGGLSKLSVWWLRLGITVERIRPATPTDNGRHERMHRTLKQETATPPKADINAQQAAFDTFVHSYNHDRPHEALGQIPPADLYTPSPRSYPVHPAPISYPGHFELRIVSKVGQIRWRCRLWHISEALAGETVGLEEADNDVWTVYYGPVVLGYFKPGSHRLIRKKHGKWSSPNRIRPWTSQ